MNNLEHGVSPKRMTLEAVDFQLQPILALIAFHEQHKELEVDELHPRNNEPTVRNEAMRLWTEGENSLAGKFNEYRKLHAQDEIDITDAAALRRLLGEMDRIDGEDTATLH